MALALRFSDIVGDSSNLCRELSLIRDYLEDTQSSAEYTAEELTTLAEVSSTEPSESGHGLERFLWSLWSMVVQMIQVIPHTHPWQDKTVNLLSAIKQRPRRLTPGMVQLERIWCMYFWQDLPIFGAELRETWNEGPWERNPYPGDIQLSPDVWTNMNAFAARLTAASVMNFETYATWTLGHTLENERWDEEIDKNLPAAAVWITYAGRLLYHNAAKEYTPRSVMRRPDIRRLREFSEPFSEERWAFWKERFEFLQSRESLKPTTRDSAREALGNMAEIERLDPEPRACEGSSLPLSGLMRAVEAVQVRGMS